MTIFIFTFTLFANHLRPALGTGSVNAALAGHVRLLVPALGANAVAAGARAGLVTAALTAATLTASWSTPALTAAALAASATKVSV
ncbi:MAG: hypothetical protein KKC71_07745 [Chloroflexi bacterium]|nr:hypothetical protein [Chloroflexota bacterium]